jgi:hypothetical protein
LIDAQYCRGLQNDLARLVESGWEILKATKTAWRMVPDDPGLYMFIWRPTFEFEMAKPGTTPGVSWVLYVGSAGARHSQNTLRKRYRQEYADLVGGDPDILWGINGDAMTREKRLRRYLSLTPLQYWFTVVPDTAVIADLERRLFAMFAPPLNAIGSLRLRPAGEVKRAF